MVITSDVDRQILALLDTIHRLRKRLWKAAPYTMEMFYAPDKIDPRIIELKKQIEKLKLKREQILAQYRAEVIVKYNKEQV